MLARREHARFELRQKLEQRGFSLEDIDPVLDDLSEQGLLSDDRFAEVYSHHRTEAGFGPVRIRAELRQRGVGGDIIDNVVSAGDDEWLGVLRRVWTKRFGETVPKEFRERMKQMRYLQYRGFTNDQIRTLFD